MPITFEMIIHIFIKIILLFLQHSSINWLLRGNVIKLFCPYFMKFCNNIDRVFAFPNGSILANCLWARLGAYTRVPALPTNIRLGWKDLSGANTLDYYEHS
jgi:hypothetical protein